MFLDSLLSGCSIVARGLHAAVASLVGYSTVPNGLSAPVTHCVTPEKADGVGYSYSCNKQTQATAELLCLHA
jgi:hypothetical protein